ncbi:MAG: hypothetical protein HRT87_04960, partial [Legionellales bacterium]|nr:hypothetical protein [Legionellales bacterium]
MSKILALCIFISMLVMVFLSNVRYYSGEVSDHFDGKRFHDPMSRMNKNSVSFFHWILTRKSTPWPDYAPVEAYDIPPLKVEGNKLRVSNVGHVTFLIQTQGLNILTDPVWS